MDMLSLYRGHVETQVEFKKNGLIFVENEDITFFMTKCVFLTMNTPFLLFRTTLENESGV